MREAKNCFTKSKYTWKHETAFRDFIEIETLGELKKFLDIVHIRSALIKPLNEFQNYPIVDFRSLMPSFDSDPFEYHELPGFSMLIFDRPLQSFSELFQYDPLFPVSDVPTTTENSLFCPLENQTFQINTQTFLSRMPKFLHDGYRSKFTRTDVTLLDYYPALLSILLQMDRAHVIAKNSSGSFQLSGIFASFPSDIDGELKRFGIRIGKFQAGNSNMYLRNRLFTLQFLMELYGFPVSSERRTSAALFARKLHKVGEKFMIRVMGQSDRTLTTIWNDGKAGKYPYVEKIALVRIENQEDIDELLYLNAFVDNERRIAIARVVYRQHIYSQRNVRQDRALSVFSQSIIHPETGEDITHIKFLHDTSSILLSLSDISHGEYHGKTIYKRTELIENTDTEEKRLKTFYAWLLKHQRRIISYTDESYSSFKKLFYSYFETIQYIDNQHELSVLKAELEERFFYINQARTLRDLEEITSRNYKNMQLSYDAMLTEAVKVLYSYKSELIVYFEDLASTAIQLLEVILNDRYLKRNYLDKDQVSLSARGLEIRNKYNNLVQLHDEFKAIQKTHKSD